MLRERGSPRSLAESQYRCSGKNENLFVVYIVHESGDFASPK